MTMQDNMHSSRIGSQRKHTLFTVLTLTMLIGTTVVWILNILGIIGGPWGAILGAMFAVLGVILARPFWDAPSFQETSAQHYSQTEGIDLGISAYTGALLAKTKRSLRGAPLDLCQGFDTAHQEIIAADNVGERMVDGHMQFIGVFPGLKVGNYIVRSSSQKWEAKVTIYAGQVTEVDWH